MKKIVFISTAFLVLSLVIASFAIYAKTNITNDCMSVEDAKKVALTHAPDAKVTKIKLEYDDGITEYEIEMFDETYKYEIEFNAVTGTLIDLEKSVIKQSKEIPDNLMDINDILKIVYTDAGYKESEVVFINYELERDNGEYIYEIEFYVNGAKYDYEISAVDGSIYEFEVQYSL